jgi:hypothetical protein
MNFLIYDELKFRFEGDLVFDQEVLFGELSTVILEQTGQNLRHHLQITAFLPRLALAHDFPPEFQFVAVGSAWSPDFENWNSCNEEPLSLLAILNPVRRWMPKTWMISMMHQTPKSRPPKNRFSIKPPPLAPSMSSKRRSKS